MLCIYDFIAIITALSEAAVRTLLMLVVCGAFLFSNLLSSLKKNQNLHFKIIKTKFHTNLRAHNGNCCYRTPSSQMQIVSGYQMQLGFVTRIFFCLFSGILPTDCVKLWTLNSLGGTGCFYALKHEMLKTSQSSYILLTLHRNHLVHFRVSELFWQYSKCILMETILIQTVTLHSTELIRILSQGFSWQAELWLQKAVALSQILYL